MSDFSYNSELLTRYLLGQLSEAERDRLEEEYFCNNEVFLALLDAKDQLISNYLNKTLTTEERNQFERHFLALPDRKREVELAASFRSPLPNERLLTNRITSEVNPSRRSGAPGLGKAYRPWIFTVAAVLFVGSIIALQMTKKAPLPAPSQEQSANTSIPAGQPTVTLSLKRTAQRSSLGQDITAKIGRETQTLELKLEVSEETFPSYQGSLYIKGKEGEVFSDDSLHSIKDGDGTQIVIWRVPAAKLQIEDYTASLKGIVSGNPPTRIGDYDFEVRPENVQQSK